MKKKMKSVCMAVAIGMILAGIALNPMVAFAWGDSDGGRPSYTKNQINSGILGDKIVFNSISDSTIGDEKNFVGAREDTGINAGSDNVWNANDITVEDGKIYLVRLYVHNNNPNGTDAVSENTRVAFNIPVTSAKQIQVNGYIYSDNAAPSEYWDYVNFNADVPFHLEYVKDAASLENNGIGKNGGIALSDNIVYKAASEHGVQIGYDSLNGEVPGCYEYASYVGIKVKVVYDNVATAFADVPASAYYAAPVAWAVENGITKGTSATAFSPNQTCTIRQILTFLCRAKTGNPATTLDAACAWAIEKGMIAEDEDTTAPCTRLQAVTFMWQAAGEPEVEEEAYFEDTGLDAAVDWAVAKGVTQGTSNDTFSPNNTCTRGQIVTFLYRDLAQS